MQWIFNKNQKRYESECKRYRIENNCPYRDEKGQQRKNEPYYCIMTKDPISQTWCKQIAMGELGEMLNKQIGEKE